MRFGLCGLSALVLLGAQAWAQHEKAASASPKNQKALHHKNGTDPLRMPETPKLPVPWQKLSANLEKHTPHHKKKVPLAQNHSNKTHVVQHQAVQHSKEENEARLQADTDGAVQVQALPKDVAAKIEAKLVVTTPASKRKPLPPRKNSTHDAMAVLHHEAELHKGKKQHVKKSKNKTIDHDVVKQQDVPKHEHGLSSLNKDLGVNTSTTNHTKPVAKVSSHKAKKHGHKAKKVQTLKPSFNVTGGDAMAMVHHVTPADDSKKTKHTLPLTTTTHAPAVAKPFSKGLMHLRNDMWLSNNPSTHPNPTKSAHSAMPVAASSAKTVHSALSVGKKHHKGKSFKVLSAPSKSFEKDPMAAVHKEAASLHTVESSPQTVPDTKPASAVPDTKTAPAAVSVEDSQKHSGGLSNLDDALDIKEAPAVKNEPQEPEASAFHPKPSSHGGKHHKKFKASAPAPKLVAPADKADPIAALHHELHPEQHDEPKHVPAATKKASVPQAKSHESRRNNLRKLRDDLSR